MRSAKAAAFLLMCNLICSGWVLSQSATTSVRGTISDAKEAVITGATVTLNNQATGFSRSVKTDDQGSYQFLEVPPATYVMTVTATGFATAKRENVLLQVYTWLIRPATCVAAKS